MYRKSNYFHTMTSEKNKIKLHKIHYYKNSTTTIQIL